MKLAPSQFEEIAQELEQHREALRIKKLLYCACTSYWENNSNILDSFSFKVLVEELRKSYQRLEEVRNALHQIAATLNRRTFYTQLADTVVYTLGRLYGEPSAPKSDSSADKPPQPLPILNPERSRLDAIADRLDRHEEAVRIKKFLFLASKNRWQNDAHVLKNYSFQELLSELLQQYSVKRDLKSALNKLVKDVNKPGLYGAIAGLIYNEVKGFYQQDQDDDSDIPTRQHFSAEPQETEAKVDRKVSLGNPKAFATVFETEDEPSLSPSGIRASNQQPLPFDYDAFQLRQEIMRYANPLKVKILLFSAVYNQFISNESDWLRLRELTLDDLLDQLLRRHPSFETLDSKLTATAQAASDSAVKLQIAGAISQLIKPYYRREISSNGS
ncbi:MAG: hypothetical protein HC890_12090 [Chloroflexaceae bacterium]|nr:hypothetical protein [Chloroflexaceae bacterium]